MSSHPYEQLTPDVVLDALSSVGLHGDGRLLGLSSYENRVYEVQLEDACEGNPSVVAKFYRPNRWSEAQILEEHGFAAELMAAEIPAVGPLVGPGVYTVKLSVAGRDLTTKLTVRKDPERPLP